MRECDFKPQRNSCYFCNEPIPRELFDIFGMCKPCISRIRSDKDFYYQKIFHDDPFFRKVNTMLKLLYAITRYKDLWDNKKEQKVIPFFKLKNIYSFLFEPLTKPKTIKFAMYLNKVCADFSIKPKSNNKLINDKHIKDLFDWYKVTGLPSRKRR